MNKLILLIEDSSTDEKLTLRAIKKTGIASEVDVVRDGAEALEYLFCTGRYASRNNAEVPALILLDLKLPRIDGLEVLRRVRSEQRTRLLPIVVLTASRQEEDIVQSYLLGANAYVRKPVEYSEFAQTANALLTFWLSVNESAPSQRALM